MDDSIRRSDAIDAAREYLNLCCLTGATFHKEMKDYNKGIATEIFEDIPAVEPKRGEWIDKGWHGDWQFETDGRGNCWHEYECSECGFCNKGSKSNYCPNCGAKMKGADE